MGLVYTVTFSFHIIHYPHCTTVRGADVYSYANLSHTLMSESTSYITHIVPLYVGLVYMVTLLFYVIHYPHCTTVRGAGIYAYAISGHTLLRESTLYITHIVPQYVGLVYTPTMIIITISCLSCTVHYPHCITLRGAFTVIRCFTHTRILHCATIIISYVHFMA